MYRILSRFLLESRWINNSHTVREVDETNVIIVHTHLNVSGQQGFYLPRWFHQANPLPMVFHILCPRVRLNALETFTFRREGGGRALERKRIRLEKRFEFILHSGVLLSIRLRCNRPMRASWSVHVLSNTIWFSLLAILPSLHKSYITVWMCGNNIYSIRTEMGIGWSMAVIVSAAS